MTTQRLTLTAEEAAELIGVSRATMYALCREKQIPHIRVRQRILLHRATLEAWLNGEIQAVAPAAFQS